MKLNHIALLGVLTVCLLAMPAVADYNNDGWPVLTRANDTINGSVFIDSESNFGTSTTLNSNVPAGTVEHAYLYTGVWGGTESNSGWMNITFNGDSSSNGLGLIHLEGIDDNNSNVWCTGHGKYWMWYDVTSLVDSGQVNTATVSKINGSIDGRIYGIALVVVLENQSEPMIRYWINDGSDGLNYNTNHDDGTTYFNGNVDTGNLAKSSLTMIHLTADLAANGCLEFNGHPLSTDMISNYFELNTWNELNSNVKPTNVTSSGNNAWYSRGNDPYANVCNAILVLEYGGSSGEELEFGDAPDPTYPSLLLSDGARHIPTETECLGLNITTPPDWKDFEPDANIVDQDLFDDGLLTTALIINNSSQTVDFEVTNLIPGDQSLIANILLDLNADGDWDDVVNGQSEYVVRNQNILLIGTGDGIYTSTQFSTIGATSGPTWMRITLTRQAINSGWNGTMASAGYEYPFECGETEDWEVNIGEGGETTDLEFGDAPDPIYPSLLLSDGARHNPTGTECLGLNISTYDWKDFEPDANIIDQDLFDDGLLTTMLVANDPAQTVDFEVTNYNSTDNLIVNILLDLNSDGDWNDIVNGQSEHVVQNQTISLTGPAEAVFTSSPFSTVGATPGPAWMRVTLTRSPINSGWDGTMTGFAQMTPFACGETEDFEVYIEDDEPTGADLIVTAINAYHYNTGCTPWFNLSNEIDITVTNNGGGAAAPSSVSLYIEDVLFGVLPVSGLGAGMNETVTFSNWKPIGYDCLQVPCNYACSEENYNLTAVADCNSDVAESNEANNATTVVETVCYNGYIADEPLGNMFHGTLNGGLIFTTGDGTYGSVPDSSYKDTIYQITLPQDASVELARLNVYYTWHYEATSCPQYEVTITNTSGTYVVPLDAAYNDIKCWCSGAAWVFPWGNYVYDVTPYIHGSGTYTVGIKRTGGPSSCMSAPGIEVLYQDDTKPLIEYWINEGADVLIGGYRSDGGYLAWEECINNATFQASSQNLQVVNATLGVVSAWGDDATNDILFFNGVEIGRGVYHGFGGTYQNTIN
ncbi:MAG: DUF3344 domain-containing protein, partial [Methanosarcinaceae archaeon]